MAIELTPGWIKFATRLQAEACRASKKWDGYTVMSIAIVVDNNGNPVAWLEPATRQVEPYNARLGDAILHGNAID